MIAGVTVTIAGFADASSIGGAVTAVAVVTAAIGAGTPWYKYRYIKLYWFLSDTPIFGYFSFSGDFCPE